MPKAAKNQQEPSGPFGDMIPYRETFETFRELPTKGRQPEEVRRELRSIARQENVRWQTGQISGTYFHGGMEHYAYLNRVFALFSHVNPLHRDMSPSGTKFEGEIIAMTARMLGADPGREKDPQAEVCGAITSGGTEGA